MGVPDESNCFSDDDPSFTPTTTTNHNTLPGRSTADAHPASAITTDNDWNGNLTAAGTNLAAVLDVIDDLALGGGGGAVDSVNGETGTVVLDAADVDAAPTSRTISAGTGLTGGGDLSANRTLAVSYGTTAGTAAQGNDSRLSDARTPTSHVHGAADISSGTVATARLGSGSASASTFLRGDQTWAAPSSSAPVAGTTAGIVAGTTAVTNGTIVTVSGFYAAGDAGAGSTYLVEAASGETWTTMGAGFDMDTSGRIKITGATQKLVALNPEGVPMGAYGLRVGGGYFGNNAALLLRLITYAGTVAKPVLLPPGTFHFSQVNFPTSCVVRVVGAARRGTTVTYTGSAVTFFSLVNSTDVTIENIRFVGNLSAGAAKTATSSTGAIGINWRALTSAEARVVVKDCDFLNMGGGGIVCDGVLQTTNTRSPGNEITGCRFYNCGYGIDLGARAEYFTVNHCSTTACWTGVRVLGGNNQLANSHFNENRHGIKLEEGSNSGHGSAVGCSFNHNTDYAIHAVGLTLGYTFTGCQAFDGDILLDDCDGVVITSTQLGGPMVITASAGGRNTIRDCFYTTTGGAVSVVHALSDNTVLDNVFDAAATLLA